MSRWQALLSGAIEPGVYRLPARTPAEAVRRAVAPAGWRVFVIEGDKVSDKGTFLSEAARAMDFPSYFGKNWDAFEDSLNDLEWAPAKGYVILYPHAERFAQLPDWKTVLSIFQVAVRRWQQAGVPMYIFLGGVNGALAELEQSP